MGNAGQEALPHYEVLNGLIEAAKRNQQAAHDATEALSEVTQVFDSKTPFPHYAVLNGLIEAAKRNQDGSERATEAISTAIAKLQRETSSLPNTLLEPVANKLWPKFQAEFKPVTGEMERATLRLQQIAATSVWKLFLIPTLCFVFGIGVMWIRLFITVPRRGQLEALQTEKQRLEATIATLEAKGGKAVLSTCGPTDEFGVQTDESQGQRSRRGSKSSRIIYGY